MTEATGILQKPYEKLSGGVLKSIALLTMLIDHVAAVVLYHYMSYTPMAPEQWEKWDLLYTIMRNIGRTSFPLFCFLLCEGFFHTSSRSRQAGRLLLFALISEIPYDLAVMGYVTGARQNVFFTLLVGYLMIWALEWTRERLAQSSWWLVGAAFALLFTGTNVAELICADYGKRGVLLIAILYLFRLDRPLAGIAGYVCMIGTPWCFPAFLLIQCYNGKRGVQLKYLFYLFYPVHLMALYLLTLYNR